MDDSREQQGLGRSGWDDAEMKADKEKPGWAHSNANSDCITWLLGSLGLSFHTSQVGTEG